MMIVVRALSLFTVLLSAFASTRAGSGGTPDSGNAKGYIAGYKGDASRMEIGNGITRVVFDAKNGTFSIYDAEGRLRIKDAGVGATSCERGASFSMKAEKIKDIFGSGVRVTFTVTDDTVGFRWGFRDANYEHPNSMDGAKPVYTYTLYDGNPALIASFGTQCPIYYRYRHRGATVMRDGAWLADCRAGITHARTINSSAGSEPAHLLSGMTRRSANGLIWTGLVDGRRRSLVVGGLANDAFGKYVELLNGSLTLYANDEVGVLIDKDGLTMFNSDTFYIDAVTDDPFKSAEAYGLAIRKANGCNPNVYDFPLLCGWAVGALSKLGYVNYSTALVKELDYAKEKGFTKYSKVGVRLEPDYYCYFKNGNTEQGWYDDAHFAAFGHLRAPYDTFAKWCAAVRERNGIPYTYIQVGMPSNDFAKKHPDWMLFNSIDEVERKHRHHQPFVTYDFTDKGMIEHYRSVWKRFAKDGIQGIKFDYPETGYNPQGGFENPRMSAVQVYRSYFALAREGLGKDAFIDERNLGECARPCLDVTAGIVDTQRTWNDSNKFDSRMITTDALRWYKMRTVFNYYPDAKAMHNLPEAERRSMLTTVYLTSGRIELATSFRLFTPEMVWELSRLYPEYRQSVSARPVDAFKEGVVNPSVFDLELSQSCHHVMLFNPHNKPGTIAAALCGDRAKDGALGLDVNSKWRVHAFWSDRYHGILGNGQSISGEFAARCSEMYRLTLARPHPQVVSTTRHILQGWMDIADEKWDEGTKVLSGVAKHIAENTSESVVIAVDMPDGTAAYKMVKSEISPEDRAAGVKVSSSESNGVCRITFTTPVARNISWKVTFKR
jgi:hypothetical protein